MSVWITGANGFIARHLARELSSKGMVVDGIGYGAPQDGERQRWGYRFCLNGEIDASNLHALAAMTELPTVIYHLAGGSSVGSSLTQPHEDFSRTVVGTERLLEWLRVSAPQCRLLAVSSAAVYGASKQGQIPEDAPLDPVSPYGEHKRMMEQLCQHYATTFGLAVVVARLFSVYGPMLRKQILWDLCGRLHRGESEIVLNGTGQEIRDWTSVYDAVRLLALLPSSATENSCRIYNGGSGTGVQVAQLAQSVTGHWGGNAKITFSGKVRAGDPVSLVSDSRQIEAMGFNWITKLDSGVADYIRWFKNN